MPNFIIIGNSWDAGVDNPTSKHQIALKLGEMGHRVLWVDGAGIRRPSFGSGGDRAKMSLKLRRGLKRVYIVAKNIWRISPLILPFPGVGAVRWMNERIYIDAIRRAVRRIGLADPVLINFLPTIPGVLAKWSIENRELRDCGIARLWEKGKTTDSRLQTEDPINNRTTEQPSNLTTGHKVATIYYCVDRWDQFEAYDSGLMARLDAECCRNADLVIASAQDLYERCRLHNENCYLLPHGVDWGHFARAMGKTADQRYGELRDCENAGFATTKDAKYTNRGMGDCLTPGCPQPGVSEGAEERDQRCGADLCTEFKSQAALLSEKGRGGFMPPKIGGINPPLPGRETEFFTTPCSMLHAACSAARRIGFFGLISEWVDQDLLIALAEKIEDCELVLAGKADVNTDRLAGIKNIRMIGSVPYADLPALVGSFDAGIIPFEVNELTRAVNPIKLREMLAAGCPVVSTALPEVEKLAGELPDGAVMVAGSHDEFVECVRAVLRSIEHGAWSMEKRKLISDSVKDQDWSAKVDEILEILNRSRE